MQAKELKEILAELSHHAEQVQEEDVEQFVSLIESAGSVFLAGAGRSGFMMRAFANRLMHLGYHAYLVGETTTPPIKAGDVLIIGSGSGETDSLVTTARRAKEKGAKVALISVYRESTIGKLADVTVVLPGSTQKSNLGNGVTTIQPRGSSFEQLLFLTADSIVLNIQRRKNMPYEEMFARHANLE